MLSDVKPKNCPPINYEHYGRRRHFSNFPPKEVTKQKTSNTKLQIKTKKWHLKRYNKSLLLTRREEPPSQTVSRKWSNNQDTSKVRRKHVPPSHLDSNDTTRNWSFRSASSAPSRYRSKCSTKCCPCSRKISQL